LLEEEDAAFGGVFGGESGGIGRLVPSEGGGAPISDEEGGGAVEGGAIVGGAIVGGAMAGGEIR